MHRFKFARGARAGSRKRVSYAGVVATLPWFSPWAAAPPGRRIII
jgi:hypothetical protein